MNQDKVAHDEVCHKDVCERMVKVANTLVKYGQSDTNISQTNYAYISGKRFNVMAFHSHNSCAICHQHITARLCIRTLFDKIKYNMCEYCNAAGLRLCPMCCRNNAICGTEQNTLINQLLAMFHVDLPHDVVVYIGCIASMFLKCNLRPEMDTRRVK